jgi:hypothetical protein
MLNSQQSALNYQLCRDTHVLRLGEEAQRFVAAFAANAALFDAPLL